MNINELDSLLDVKLQPIKDSLSECKIIIADLKESLQDTDNYINQINQSLDSINNTFSTMNEYYDSYNRNVLDTVEKLTNMVYVSGKGHQPGCDPDT